MAIITQDLNLRSPWIYEYKLNTTNHGVSVFFFSILPKNRVIEIYSNAINILAIRRFFNIAYDIGQIYFQIILVHWLDKQTNKPLIYLFDISKHSPEY